MDFLLIYQYVKECKDKTKKKNVTFNRLRILTKNVEML